MPYSWNMRSRVPPQKLHEAITKVLAESKHKKENTWETVEIVVHVKNYSHEEDKRISGIIQLTYNPRPNMKLCVLGDEYHCYEARNNDVPYMNAETLESLRVRGLVSKLADKYDGFLASESIIKDIPHLVGAGLSKAGKFPFYLSHDVPLMQKVNEVQSTIKFQLRKANSMSVSVGHVHMPVNELVQNSDLLISYMVSLFKLRWGNVKELYVKSANGPPQKLY